MSPRTFAAIIGVILIGLSAWVYIGYTSRASLDGYSVSCGTPEHPDVTGHIPGIGSNARNPLFDLCRDKTDTATLVSRGLLGVGALTLIGAGFVRRKEPSGT